MFWSWSSSSLPQTDDERSARITQFSSQLLDDKGVTRALIEGNRNPSSHAFAARWLASRSWDVEAAVQAVASHAQWLSEHRAIAVADTSSVPPAIIQHPDHIHMLGLDGAGRPIMLCNLAKHKPGVIPGKERQDALVWCMEHLTRLSDMHSDGRCVIVFDLQGYSVENVDSEDASAMVDILQKQYPERLHQLFIYEAPTVFWALWNMIWPFLNASTRDKVRLVSGQAGLEELHASVPVEVLPAGLGGTATIGLFSESVAQAEEDIRDASTSSDDTADRAVQ